MPNMLINIASLLQRYWTKFNNRTNYIYLEIIRETDTTVVIYSWKYRVMTSSAGHLISHSTFWWLYSEQRVEIELLHIMVSSGHHISKLDLVPNISMIEKVVQQICAIDYLVSKYTFLLINQFVQRQIFWLMKISLKWGCWAVAQRVRTDLFWSVYRVLKLVG